MNNKCKVERKARDLTRKKNAARAPEHDVNEGAPLDSLQVDDQPVRGAHVRDAERDEQHKGQYDEGGHGERGAAHDGQPAVVEVGQQQRDREQARRARPAAQQACKGGSGRRGFSVLISRVLACWLCCRRCMWRTLWRECAELDNLLRDTQCSAL